MLRGYRGILAAIAGLILVGASPQPSSKDQAEQHKSERQPERSASPISAPGAKPVEIVQPKVDAHPCGQDQYQTNDDLCAQWKAADAASDAAWWAMVATFVTALGTIGLFWQIKLTREAVQDTGEATEAMREANKIARDNSHLELRAYLSVQSVTLSDDLRRDNSLTIALEIKNAGQTPAVLGNIHVQVHWLCEGGSITLLEHVSRNDIRCHRDTPMHIHFNVPADDPKLDLPGNFMVFGHIQYKDVFGKSQKEPFNFQSPVPFVTLDEHDLPVRLAAYSVVAIVDAVKEEQAKRKSAKAKKPD